MVILDTNIIIDHLRQSSAQETRLMKLVKSHSKAQLGLSVISVQELYEGQSTLDAQAEEYLLATISPLKILPYTYETAQLAGEIARDIQRPIELADAAIAATTLLHSAQLYTLNKKDFSGILDLELI